MILGDSESTLTRLIPELELSAIQHAFLLPDRSIRTDVLLGKWAATARNAGAEIRTETPVANLLRDGDSVHGVATALGEEIHARLVILATGATGVLYDVAESSLERIEQHGARFI